MLKRLDKQEWMYQKIKLYETNFISFTITFDSPQKRIDTLRDVNL